MSTVQESAPPHNILGLGSDEFASLARRLVPATAGLAPRIYTRVFATGALNSCAEGASPAHQADWIKHFRVGLLDCASRTEEEGDAGTTTKFVFRLGDGALIESVSIPMHGGTTTLCVSSQVGCARACAFCQTGTLGLTRNLAASEIVAQVLSASFLVGVRFRTIVFMGMGEPLDNLAQVAKAIEVLQDRRGLSYSQERITVCTAGHAPGIEALGRLGLRRLNLSLSLNAATDTLRDHLMPINRTWPLASLQVAIQAYPRRRNFVLALNYCLIPDCNDSPADLDAVAAFVSSLGRAIVNLIPYNPGSRPIGRLPTEAETDAAIEGLRSRGLIVHRRVAKGRGLMAACGQLGKAPSPNDGVSP